MGYLIAALVIAVIVWMIYAGLAPPDEEHYCLKCGKVTLWHHKRGCTTCRTLDQCF